MQGSESCLFISAVSDTLLHPPVVFPSHSSGWNSFSARRWAQQGPATKEAGNPRHLNATGCEGGTACGCITPFSVGPSFLPSLESRCPFQHCFPCSPAWHCLQSFLLLLESKITRFMGMIFFFFNLTNTTNAFSRVFEALTLHGLLSFGKENLEKPCWVCRAEESL